MGAIHGILGNKRDYKHTQFVTVSVQKLYQDQKQSR